MNRRVGIFRRRASVASACSPASGPRSPEFQPPADRSHGRPPRSSSGDPASLRSSSANRVPSHRQPWTLNPMWSRRSRNPWWLRRIRLHVLVFEPRQGGLELVHGTGLELSLSEKQLSSVCVREAELRCNLVEALSTCLFDSKHPCGASGNLISIEHGVSAVGDQSVASAADNASRGRRVKRSRR